MTVLCMIYLKKFGILGLVLGEGVRQEGPIFLLSDLNCVCAFHSCFIPVGLLFWML